MEELCGAHSVGASRAANRKRMYSCFTPARAAVTIVALDVARSAEQLGVADGFHVLSVHANAEGRILLVVRSMQPPKPGDWAHVAFVLCVSMREAATHCLLCVGKA